MRILLLCHNYPEFGTYFRALGLARQLVKRGRTAVLMLISRERAFRIKRYELNGVRIIECPNFQPLILNKEDGWGPLDILLRCAYGITRRFDIVIGFGHKPDIAIPALLIKYLKRVTFISDWCDLWGGEGIFTKRGLLKPKYLGTPPDRTLIKLETFMEKFILRKADIVTVICTPLKDICEKWGIRPDKSLLLPSGSDTEGIAVMSKAQARKELNLPADKKILAYLGNYHQEAKFLFESFERICRERDDVRLLIIGPEFLPQDPEEKQNYEERDIMERGKTYRAVPEQVRDRIIWTGKKPYAEIYRYLAAADILLLPMENNTYERTRWPNKLCDYLAGGRPIAITDVGDAGAFVRENGCGIVTGPSLDLYCEAILANLDNEALLDQLGSHARSVAENDLSWGTITEKFLQFVTGELVNKK